MHKYVPGCAGIKQEGVLSSLCSLPSGDEGGLVLQFFELGKLFAEKRMVRFSAQGRCMYPGIRPADTLQIEPKYAQDIEIGDVVVYRRYNRLVGHRAIAKGKAGSLEYIITRPDTARHGDDGRIFDEDILGAVSHIERKGHIVSPKKKKYSLAERVLLDLALKWFSCNQYLFKKVVYIITYIQQLKIYRGIAKFLFFKVDKKIIFSIQTPLNDKVTDRFYKVISSKELITLNANADPEAIRNWNIAFHIHARQAAFLSLIYKPKSCPFSGWWIFNLNIKIRYRATRIEEKFFQQIEELLRQLGITEVHASVLNRAYLDRMILKNMGFQETLVCKDEHLKDRNNLAIERLIMEKKIG